MDGDLRRAADALRRGLLVVFPTETVYGLGANALDEHAVRSLFSAKGRPADNPLIVHVPSVDAARRLTSRWPDAATLLAQAFWPGPLTMVLPKAPHVPDVTTGGLDSVALRVPAHPLARSLLEEAGVPLAAPSANASGRPSPTRVEDARADLGDRVEVYLDGGPTFVGLESSVVDLRGEPAILRPGGVPRDAIEAVVGPLAAPTDPARSPGTRYRHYAPRTPLWLAAPDELADRLAALRRGGRVAVVASEEHAPAVEAGVDVVVPGGRDDAAAWAHRIFALLRDLDAGGYAAILVEEPAAGGIGEAVLDRLRRAAQASSEAPSEP